MDTTTIIILSVILYFLINLGFASLITKFNKKLMLGRIFWACLMLSPIFGALVAIIDILTETPKEDEKDTNSKGGGGKTSKTDC